MKGFDKALDVVTASPNALSVRWRRVHIAGLIEQIARRQQALAANWSCSNEITPWHCNLKQLPTRDEHGGFDFIYSIGIYDYLTSSQASQLTAWLMAKLNPGGKLLIANFTIDNWGRGHMEAFMDWNLVVRSREQMRAFIPRGASPHTCLYYDPYRNVIYLLLSRPA